MLHLGLFGGFSLTAGGGQAVMIELAKSRALLCYLAINSGRKIDRNRLASLLWGSQPQVRARHSLTQALCSLVQALGAQSDAIRRSRDAVSLQEGGIEVDVVRLQATEETADPASLLTAIDLFQAEVFRDFSFDEAAFDEWALTLRECLHDKVLKLGMAYLALEDSDRKNNDTIRVARKLLQIDPFFEPGHRALIQLHANGGDLGAAWRQAEVCREILDKELGVAPGPETQRLISEIFDATLKTAPDGRQFETGKASRVQPSLVVLALQNLTEDPSLQHICQGLSDDITTELCRYRSLFVISRESAFQIGGESENLSALCRRLAVRYALCGSLRPHQGQLRITLRLVDGETGQTLWSERYDAGKAEILEISDDVTGNLVTRLVSSLEEDVLSRARRNAPTDWSAYDHLLQGLVYHHKSWYGTGMLFGAVKHFRKAVALDPGLARAHAYLACALSAPWFKNREDSSLDRSLKHANLAVEIDPFEAEAQRILGGIHLVHGDHELARHHFQLALREHPGNAHILAHAARFHAYTGASEDAVAMVNRARQLNPLHPAWYWQQLGVAKFGQGDYQQTIRLFSRLPYLAFFDRLYLAAAHAHLGEETAAARHLQVAKTQKPELTLSGAESYFPYNGKSDLLKVMDGLVAAGLS